MNYSDENLSLCLKDTLIAYAVLLGRYNTYRQGSRLQYRPNAGTSRLLHSERLLFTIPATWHTYLEL